MTNHSYMLTLQLSLCIGFFGADRFYLGKTGTGILKLLSTFLFGIGLIWWIVDIFLLLYNKQTDINGNQLTGQDKRDPLMLIFLSSYFGVFGLDRFYLNQTRLGIIKGLTLGGLGIWLIIDIYLTITQKNIVDKKGRPIESDEKKYQSIALIYSGFGGFFGFDRFYLGYRTLGILKLFIPTFGLWVTIDFILLILNKLDDAKGNRLDIMI